MSKNTVYDVLEYELQDQSTVVLKPATIKTMRAFNRILNNSPDPADGKREEDADIEDAEEAGFDWIMSMVMVLLKKQRPDLTLEDAEDIIDMDTAYKIIEVCGGVKLNDPKLLEIATQALSRESVGTN